MNPRAEAAAMAAQALYDLDQRPDQARSFRDYVRHVFPDYVWHKHCEVLAEWGQKLVDREISRLFIAAPPQFGKSQFVRMILGYHLERFPSFRVGLASYNSDLANEISLDARGYYESAGGVLMEDAQAIRNWRTPEGGGLWATGVAGGQTGKPASMLVIDDPVKNDLEGASPTVQRKHQNWYRSSWINRWNRHGPPLAQIHVQTRWDENDLGGWLLQRAAEDAAQAWTCVILPEIYDSPEAPRNCYLVPDWRLPGEPLCPAITPIEKSLSTKGIVGEYYWSALHQQQPRPATGGGMFKRWWFHRVAPYVDGENRQGMCPPLNEMVSMCRAWDLGATADGGDHTAGVLMGRHKDGNIFWIDTVRKQLSPAGVDELILRTAEEDGKAVTISVPQDPGAAGKSEVASKLRLLRGYRVTVSRPTGSKMTRARPLASAAEPSADGVGGRVFLVQGDWNEMALSELHSFDGLDGHSDDIVDAAADCFNHIEGRKLLRHLRRLPW